MTTPGDIVRLDTARWTGVFYLGLALTGALGFMTLRPRLFDAADPAASLDRLAAVPGIARWVVALELGVVLAQALAAVWFFRLFRPVDSFAAGLIAAFGLVNAVLVLVSAGLLAAAVSVAAAPFGDAVGTVGALYLVSGSLWTVGGVPFGLWLVPMGWLVLRSGWMPRALGWVLVVGGACYVVSAFVGALEPDARAVADAFGYPATVGEVWMIGHLLVRGGRGHTPPALAPVATPATPATMPPTGAPAPRVAG